MKPLMLYAHSRALTQIKYNIDGDLLFSASKDSTPCVWYSHNGERLGTFEGHNGTVWCVDVDYRSERLLTGSADMSFKIWDISNGKQLASISTKSPVRTCQWSYDATRLFVTTDKAMGHKCEILVFDVNQIKQEGSDAQPIQVIPVTEKHGFVKATSALWNPLGDGIITGHEDGSFTKWDLAMNTYTKRDTSMHTGLINDMQYSKDFSMIISASKDFSSSLFDRETLKRLKLYKTERPVNSAAISPLKEHVVVGGGQEAMSVTTTSGKAGKFDARFFHMIFEEEMGRVKGHFGPINTLAFHPDGHGYSSGGEDGFVRVHNFDPSYFEFEFEH